MSPKSCTHAPPRATTSGAQISMMYRPRTSWRKSSGHRRIRCRLNKSHAKTLIAWPHSGVSMHKPTYAGQSGHAIALLFFGGPGILIQGLRPGRGRPPSLTQTICRSLSGFLPASIIYEGGCFASVAEGYFWGYLNTSISKRIQ